MTESVNRRWERKRDMTQNGKEEELERRIEKGRIRCEEYEMWEWGRERMRERKSLKWSSEGTNLSWKDGTRDGKGEWEREDMDLSWKWSIGMWHALTTATTSTEPRTISTG